MIHRNSILVYAVVCGCVCVHASVTSADQYRPVERLGRWSGYGWGDGYHACESSGFRLVADLPPRSFSSTFGHKTNKCGNKSCGHHGCNGCGGTFYHRFDAANAAMCDQSPCDGLGCDAAYGFQAMHGDSLLSAADEDFAALPTPSALPDVTDSDLDLPFIAKSQRSRLASTEPSKASPRTTVFPVKVQPSGTPDAATFRLLDRGPTAALAGSRGQTTTTRVPSIETVPSSTKVAVRRPSRLPSVEVASQAPAPLPVSVSSPKPNRAISTVDFGQPPIMLNPFAR